MTERGDSRWYQTNKEKISAEYSQKYRTNPAFRKKRKAASLKYYRDNKVKVIARTIKFNRIRKLAHHGLTIKDYDHLSKNGCMICSGKQKKKRLALDHCHKTGKFRGVLCDKCNKGLGLLGDTLEALYKAVDYLLRAD